MAGSEHDLIAPPTVEQDLELDLPPDELWPILTGPDGLDWLGESVSVDIRPGGTGTVVDDEGVVREVLVTEVDPDRRLSWHWWADTGDLSTVEITLVPSPAGTIVHVIETMAMAMASGVDDLGSRPQASVRPGMAPGPLESLRSVGRGALVISC